MRRIFTPLSTIVAMMAISFSSSAQCVELNQSICNDPANLVADFPMTPPPGLQTDGQGFTSASFTPHQGAMTVTGVDASSTYTLHSPGYFFSGANNVQLGFRVSRNAAGDIDVLTINVRNANTNALLGSCVISDPGGNANSFRICRVIGFPGGMFTGQIYYEFIFETDANIPGNNGTIQFDDFAVGGDAQAPLPVQFTSVTARKTAQGIQVSWNVAQEENVESYHIERSSDGRSFESIGFVAASNQPSYNYLDTRTSASTVYYRIRSVDFDGKMGYSTVVSLNGDRSSVVIKAFPSPVINDLTLQHETAEMNARITITTIDGRMVQSVVPARGTQQTRINMAAAAPGTYIVRFDNGNGQAETLKIVKQ